MKISFTSLHSTRKKKSFHEKKKSLQQLRTKLPRHLNIKPSIQVHLESLSLEELLKPSRLESKRAKVTGTIPATLASLTQLRTLHLGDNDFSSSIPMELANLVNLRVLNVSHNRLTGSIPSSFSNLQYLDVLIMSNNQITGTFPNLDLRYLNILALDSNRMAGVLPPSICAHNMMPSLEELYLSDNYFNRTIERLTFAECDMLRVLHLQRNNFVGSVPYFGEMYTIEYLYLHENMFTQIPENTFGDCTSLKIVNLANQKYQENKAKITLREYAFSNMPKSTYQLSDYSSTRTTVHTHTSNNTQHQALA